MNVDGIERASRLHRRRQDDLRLLLRRRPQDLLRLDARAPTRPVRRKPDPSKGYVWGLDPYDIYTANPDGSSLKRLTNYGVYTAEGTLSPDGQTIVFTSLKDGDLDIYTMNVDGIEHETADDAAGLRRRPVLLARRQEDRLSRLASRPTPRSRTIRICSSSGWSGPIAWRSGS